MKSRLWLTVRHLQPSSLSPLRPRAMSSFIIPASEGSDSLSVNSTSDLSRDTLLNFPAFKIWLSTLQHSLRRQRHPSHEFHKDPYILRKIDIQTADFFKGGRLGFVKLKADVSNGNGETLPGSVFLRGGSVGMLVSLPKPYYLLLYLFQLNLTTSHPAHTPT